MIDRVFVYGTLNPEHPHYNQRLVERLFGGPPTYYRTTTKGTRLPSRLPWDFVWFHEDGEDVAGVALILTAPVGQLAALDGYENYVEGRKHNHFHRKEITLEDGTKAWGYEWGLTQEETGVLYESRYHGRVPVGHSGL